MNVLYIFLETKAESIFVKSSIKINLLYYIEPVVYIQISYGGIKLCKHVNISVSPNAYQRQSLKYSVHAIIYFVMIFLLENLKHYSLFLCDLTPFFFLF